MSVLLLLTVDQPVSEADIPADLQGGMAEVTGLNLDVPL